MRLLKHLLILFFSVLLFIVNINPSLAQENKNEDVNTKPKEKVERVIFAFDPDIYYTSAAIIFNLSDKPIPNGGNMSEFEVYGNLFLKSLVPRTLLFEASVNPMPVLGTALRTNLPKTYDGAQVSNNLNMVNAVTVGFEEPYALSVFLGNVIEFNRDGEEKRGSNLGYTGYLFNTGNYHIAYNTLVEDWWYEGEIKLKGDRKFSTEILSYSIRAGVKFHDNPEIADVAYFGLRRSLVNFTSVSFFSLLKNSGIEYRMDLALRDNWRSIRHLFKIDKKWPMKNSFAFQLAIGFLWQSKTKYTGELAKLAQEDEFQILIQPNIIF